jgi:hypothetical protein
VQFAIAEILKANVPCSRGEADKRAAAFISHAAKAAGIPEKGSYAKQIASWRRSARSRPEKKPAVPPSLFRRRSLAYRVERVRDEAFHYVRCLERFDRRVDLDKLIAMILGISSA